MVNKNVSFNLKTLLDQALRVKTLNFMPLSLPIFAVLSKNNGEPV